MKKLTDIWQNLLSGEMSNSEQQQSQNERFDRIERIQEQFHKMNWTRIIRVENVGQDEFSSHDMIADFLESWDEIDN